MSTIIISSGEVSSGLVADYSNSIIVSGGTAVDTTLDDGTMSMFLADALASNTVMSGGTLYASAGRVENTTMGDGAYFSAMYSVDITGTTVNSGGTGVFRASSVNNTVVNSGGRINIYGGTVTNTTVNPGGSMSLANSNAAAYNTVITGSDYTQVVVENSATINGTTVAANAYLRLSYGAIANDTVLNSGGRLTVSNGATAANTTINEGGSMSIEGGRADLVTVNPGGWLSAGYSYNGGSDFASATRVTENGGAVYIGSGSSYDYEYDEEAGQYVYHYTYFTFPVEFTSNTFSGLVYSNYRQGTVHSNTTATDITAIAGGLTVYSGGVVNGYRATPTTWTSNYNYWEYSSHYDEETSSWVYESSLVSSAVNVTTVGVLTVSSGGKVTGLVAEALPGFDTNETYLYFQIARDTEITGTIDGTAFEMKNGALSNVSLKNAGLTYMSGANVSGVTQINGSASFLSASYARDLNFSGGKATFSRGAAADGVKTFVVPYTYTSYGMGDSDGESVETLVETSSGASVYTLFGATVTNLDMDSVSYLNMEVAPFTVLQGSSGGQAIDLKDGYFGNASLGNTYVKVLGPSSYVDEITGTTVEVSAGTVGNLTANMDAVVDVSSGATALNMTENGGAVFVAWNYEDDIPAATASFNSNTFSYDHLTGEVTVHKNTIAQDNILYEGTLNVYSGGIVNNFYTAAKDMGMINAYFTSGAIVSNFDMVRYAELPYHPGQAEFDSGVSATLVRLTDYNGLSLGVSADTVITNASLDNIPFSVVGGVLSGFVADGEGWFSDYIVVGKGAKMIDSYINAWGQVTLEEGASASNVTFANNYISVSSDSLLENATIGLQAEDSEDDGHSYTNYDSATVYVNKGGVVRDFTVNEFSDVYVSSGGKLTGTMRFDGNAQINAGSGAIVEFNLNDKSALSTARVDNLTAVDMNRYARYDIVVDAQQAAGQYVLAEYYHSDYETTFNLVSVSGTTYGYFRGGEVYEVPGDPDTAKFGYIYHADYETPQPGYGFKLDSVHVEVEGEEGAYTEQLVLTIDSTYASTAWLAAPTITADIATFTNQNVTLTGHFCLEAVTQEYSLDGTTWQVYDGLLTVTDNGTYYFRGADTNGTYSDVTSFTVSNIDKVAPTVATGLSASVIEGSTVTLDWTDATDDFSGVSSFYVACWQDGGASFTQVIPGTDLTVDTLADGTWHWALQTIDYAGNASDAVAGMDFVISGGTVTPPPTPTYVAKSDIDGNGMSDVMFVWTGEHGEGNFQHGYWMNGTSEWQ
ncbi:MAG: AIDA repeat-containing protein, partial [Lentisphaeria bacterium]|nr:AIDA repeat-containing protein [Lentisphaeria bacterium]